MRLWSVLTASVIAAVVVSVLSNVAHSDSVAVPTAAPLPGAMWLTALITAGAGVLGAFVGGYFATRNAKAAIVQKTNELEIASIDRKLAGFVAPFEQLSLENLNLTRELKRGHGGDTFRTLPALLKLGWKDSLNVGDRTLVDAVVENGNSLRAMILANSDAVSSTLRPHFAAASTHFRMLALAHGGSLEPDPARYSEYVYPRQLDGALLLERNRLEKRRELLRSKPDTSHPPPLNLVLPAELRLSPSALGTLQPARD